MQQGGRGTRVPPARRPARRPLRRPRHGNSASRLLVLLVVALVAFLTISGRLVVLQVLDSGPLTHAAAKQRLRTIELPADRGWIFDRNGNHLALSVPARTVYAQPRLITDPQGTAAKLAPLLGESAADVLAKLRAGGAWTYLARRIPVASGDQVSKLHIPGIGVLSDTARLYPSKSLAAQVLGFVGDDGKGLAGIEAQYDGLLRGHAGQLLLEQDPSGRPIPPGARSVEPAQPGTDVVLTLDEDLQYQSEQALAAAVKATKAKGGSLVAMDPRSGDILALANMPTFDPNHFGRATPNQITDRAVMNVYEPGSTSKTVTAAAALEHGVVSPSTPVTVPPSLSLCPGRVVHDAESHATERLSFGQVVAQSSNIGTIEVAQRLGRDQLVQAEQAFGYGRRTGAGLPGESAGILNPVSDWHCTDWVNAIGQGVAVTVLQMTRVYATVANGGVMVEPRLLKGTIDSSGKLNPAPASPRRRVISTTTAKTLTGILEAVVRKGGTAPAAALADWTVAGKTGTAQKPGPDGRYMPGKFVASFIGFAPAQHPAVVIAVVLDEPTVGSHFGGVVAAPVFRQVASYELHHLGIPPTVPLAQAEAAQAALPAADGDASGSPAAAPTIQLTQTNQAPP